MKGKRLHKGELSMASIEDGTETAFTKLFNEYYPGTCYFAFKLLKNQQRAEDIVQDCFLKMWLNRDRFQDIRHIKPYLYRAVHNACINNIKSLLYISEKLNTVPEKMLDPGIEDQMIQAETYSRLHKMLEILPDYYRVIIELYYLQGKSSREIASILNINLYTAKSRRAKAVIWLRKNVPDLLAVLMLYQQQTMK